VRMRGMSIAALCAGTLCAYAAQPGTSQPQSALTNSVGMEFVLVQPGTMQIGVFHPSCPDPNAPPPVFARPAAPAGAATGTPGLSTQGPNAAAGVPAARTRPPRDPRAAWTPADYQRCAELVKQDSSDGFPVKIGSPYYVGKYEVTQAQWQKVMGDDPAIFQGDKVTGDASKHPVENVTWQDAQRFVKKLNTLEKTNSYHLPTEFQWEYACRAGAAGQESWAEIREVAVEGIGGGFGAGAVAGVTPPKHPTTAEVGSKKPNAWGIYDMLGNVWEWVQDPYNDKIFPDPEPPKSGSEHVLKGGGFASDVKNTICATHGAGPGDRWTVGFRVEKDAK
jgi:formylglycine-generating enzyme